MITDYYLMEVLYIIQKKCVACVVIHRQLYQLQMMRTKELKSEDSVFTERMNREKVLMEQIIDAAMKTMKDALYEIIIKAYENSSIPSSLIE